MQTLKGMAYVIELTVLIAFLMLIWGPPPTRQGQP